MIRMRLKKAIRAMSITFFISSFMGHRPQALPVKIYILQELGISRLSRSLTFLLHRKRLLNLRGLILPEKITK